MHNFIDTVGTFEQEKLSNPPRYNEVTVNLDKVTAVFKEDKSHYALGFDGTSPVLYIPKLEYETKIVPAMKHKPWYCRLFNK